MAKKTRRPTTRRSRRVSIVVGGDVCIDWLSVPVAAEPPAQQKMNWQLRNGHHMFAVPGGAWLTGELLQSAIDNNPRLRKNVTVRLPAKPKDDLAKIPPTSIVHSMIWLEPGDPHAPLGPASKDGEKKKPDDEKLRWIVKSFEGFAGPDDGKRITPVGVANDFADADLVILDDAGNGFRNVPALWPRAARNNKSGAWFLFKVRNPLSDGQLWDKLSTTHADRTVALISGDDLRVKGGNISKRLSWERTATDVARCLLRDDPPFDGLRRCAYCVVTLGIEASILVEFDRTSPKKDRKDKIALWYTPNLIEQELVGGRMSGFGSAFAAALAASMADHLAHRRAPALGAALRAGIPGAIKSMQAMLHLGFGPTTVGEGKNKRLNPPAYPLNVVNDSLSSETRRKELGINLPKLADLDLPDCHPPRDLKENPRDEADLRFKEELRYRAWRIIETNRSDNPKKLDTYIDLAQRVVTEGLDKVFPHIPICRFGDLTMIDRVEIESYRAVRNLIHEFIGTEKPERPLCLGVFGPPGSGKSFGVTQVALNVAGKGIVEKLTFNLSQWDDPKHLVGALHQVRDQALRGKLPLVFFDEFDAPLEKQPLGWLKYFLAPMQDGVFNDVHFTHQIGKAIFIFAGGTARTYREFEKRAETRQDEVRDAKLPDFLSRLRGYVDIFGFGPPCDTNLLRRANILRSKLLKACPALHGADKKLRIDPAVVRAFLLIPEFRHGARSMEAIVDMSRLVGCAYFDPSHLPPKAQLDLHVDGRAFLCLLGPQMLTRDNIDPIAQFANYRYEEFQRQYDDDGKSLPSAKRLWRDLPDFYKNSNREHASFYPTLLSAIGCRIAAGKDGGAFKFSDEEIEKLAQLEHERWLEERRIKEPYHRDLVEWEILPESDREKDRSSIRAMPDALAEQKLYIQRTE